MDDREEARGSRTSRYEEIEDQDLEADDPSDDREFEDFEEWSPLEFPVQLTDAQIDEWIAEFAETGEVEDELGQFKSHHRTIEYAVARCYATGMGDLPVEISNAFWKWAKATAYISRFGR